MGADLFHQFLLCIFVFKIFLFILYMKQFVSGGDSHDRTGRLNVLCFFSILASVVVAHL